MPILILKTEILAPKEICFDLSRSIDLHIISTKQTGERAIAGVTSGLIGLGETVTWRAKHFGFWQNLTSKITAYDRPNLFVDEMVAGAFKHFRHEHRFEQSGKVTWMTDIFDYTSPFGRVGKMADRFFLENYLLKLLEERNKVVKEIAESDKWKNLLGMTN